MGVAFTGRRVAYHLVQIIYVHGFAGAAVIVCQRPQRQHGAAVPEKGNAGGIAGNMRNLITAAAQAELVVDVDADRTAVEAIERFNDTPINVAPDSGSAGVDNRMAQFIERNPFGISA